MIKMDVENLPNLLQHISESFSERRLYEWFICEYTDYFEIDQIILTNAHKGSHSIILFLYSCDDPLIIHEDNTWTVGTEEQVENSSSTTYSLKELTDNMTFREVLSLRFPQPFTIDYRNNGVYVSW